jgi:long-chain fatty acid transport protein
MTLHSRMAFLAVLATSTTAAGAGIEIGEQGAQATSMVGAFTAKADDTTAVYYNPAGIAKVRGLNSYVGGMVIVGQPRAESTATFMLPEGSRESDLAGSFIPNVYLAYGLPHGFAFGAGLFTNFGLQVIWPSSWGGRFVSYYAKLEDVTVNPCVSWQLTSWFSIGGGLDVTPARVDLRRAVNLIDAEASLRFRGNAVGIGGNFGVLIEIPRLGWLPPLNIGLSYRSRFKLDFDEGLVRTHNVPLELSAVLHDAPAGVNVPIPDLVSVAVGTRPVESLFLQVQLDWTGWSRLQTLQLKSQLPALNIEIPQNWHDGYTLRVGGEYAWRPVSLRLGVGYDWNPAPRSTLGPIIPDADRVLVSGGGSVKLPRGFALETALMGVLFLARRSELPELPVRYKTWGVLISFGVSYQAPQRRKDASAQAY